MTSKKHAQASLRFARLALGSVFAIGTMLLSAATMARAEDTAAPANQWTVSFTPYGWTPFLNGDMPTTILIDARGQAIGRLAGLAEWDSDDAKRLIAATLESSGTAMR